MVPGRKDGRKGQIQKGTEAEARGRRRREAVAVDQNGPARGLQWTASTVSSAPPVNYGDPATAQGLFLTYHGT